MKVSMGSTCKDYWSDISQNHRSTLLKRELSEKPKIIEIGSLLVILGWFEVWTPAKSSIFLLKFQIGRIKNLPENARKTNICKTKICSKITNNDPIPIIFGFSESSGSKQLRPWILSKSNNNLNTSKLFSFRWLLKRPYIYWPQGKWTFKWPGS